LVWAVLLRRPNFCQNEAYVDVPFLKMVRRSQCEKIRAAQQRRPTNGPAE
jgi:hypothetical protein